MRKDFAPFTKLNIKSKNSPKKMQFIKKDSLSKNRTLKVNQLKKGLEFNKNKNKISNFG